VIARLTGRIDAVTDTSCIVDVGGVGYLVQASTRTLGALPQTPTSVQLLIETVSARRWRWPSCPPCRRAT
jgi:Holliday junction DNA helicase RuvA